VKYLFKLYVWQPLATELVIEADSESAALHKVKNLKKEELEWHSNPLQTERATYEVYVESDKESSK
tara:strand:+ start:318 stop:515 length:198 start_codon:yes stop_codon:yes gene_type:complete